MMTNPKVSAEKLWADREEIESEAPPKDAYCEQCCDTAALLVAGEWRCGSCGAVVAPAAPAEKWDA